LGSFSLSSSSKNSDTFDNIRKATDFEGLIYHPVDIGDFTGGFFINPRLPYKHSDFYYFNEANDLLVLISGSVFNKSELFFNCNISTPLPDPELISILFLKEGPAFVKQLNGDFSIFIGRPAKREAYLFRDHVGVRPIAFSTGRQTLFFSSDILGLCRAFSKGEPVDSEYLLGYFKYIDYRRTPNRLVKKLLPGHFLHFSDRGIVISKFWEPEKVRIEKKLTYGQMLSELKTILEDAVKIRCDARFTAGAHVTGGLDSGVVSALARKEYAHQHDFYGFSWSPANYVIENVRYDERELVRKSCKATNIQPVFSDTESKDFMKLICDFYDNQGYFHEDKTSEQATQLSTNLILSGWGGDEFISTGDRGIETDLLLHLSLFSFFRRNKITRPRQFIKTLVYYVIFPALGFLDSATANSFRNDARYIKKPFKKSDRQALKNYYFHTSRHQLHLRQLRFYNLQERCESWSMNGFRKGLEYRYPLLDKRIIEYMLKVPSELLCKTDHFRPVLREIGEGILPEEIRWQWYKNDPVCWAYNDDLFKTSAGLLFEEIDELKANPDLHFVDFCLLTEDISNFMNQPDKMNSKVLFRALVYIKAIHEFTKKYHKST